MDKHTEVKQQIGTTGTTQTRTFVYDGMKRLTDATNPESGHVQYAYDENSNLKTKLDARSITTTYSYDALNRVTGRTYSDSTPAVSYKYDAQTLPTGAPTFTRGSSTGRLVAVTYGGGSAGNYTGYDQLGRANVSYQQRDSNNYGFGYSYNLASEMTSETYPSGRVVQTEFDSAERVAGVRNQNATWYYAGAASTDATNRIQYAAQGAVSAMKLGNGKWEHTSFNNRLQPTLIGLGTSTSDSSLLKLEYTYNTTGQANNNGNVLTQTITIGTTVMTQIYGYDALNRLSNASETGAASWSQNYGYDRFGNRWYSSGSYLPNSTLTPQSVNAFDQSNNRLIASQYDNAGNQTYDAASSGFSYDAENRQISSNVGGTSVSYSYDGDGRRVKKVVGTNTTVFVYNVSSQLIAEYTSGAPSGSGTSYLTSDHLGSTRVVTKADGSVKARYDYLPFGEELLSGIGSRTTGMGYSVADSTRQKFTQKERDNESGLDYFLARYYSSAQGRFTSPDEFAGGPDDLFDFTETASSNPTFYADLANPQSLNKYQYAYNNPLRYVDPNGHDPGDDDEQKGKVRQVVDTAAEVGVGLLRGLASSVTGGLIGAPKETDSVASRLGQAGGSALGVVVGTDIAAAGATGGFVTSPTVVGAVAGGTIAAGGVAIVSGSLVNAVRVVTTPIHQKSGTSKADAPVKAAERTTKGVTEGKTLTDKQAVQRLRRGQDVATPSKQKAKQLQKKASGGSVHDEAHRPGYRPHFHGKGRAGGHAFHEQ
jgi:RHS repeat-associated protein